MRNSITIVGMRHVNFTAKDTNRQISGWSIYYTQDTQQEGLVGVIADKIFVSDSFSLPANLTIGDVCELRYNRYGKPDELVKISK